MKKENWKTKFQIIYKLFRSVYIYLFKFLSFFVTKIIINNINYVIIIGYHLMILIYLIINILYR